MCEQTDFWLTFASSFTSNISVPNTSMCKRADAAGKITYNMYKNLHNILNQTPASDHSFRDKLIWTKTKKLFRHSLQRHKTHSCTDYFMI